MTLLLIGLYIPGDLCLPLSAVTTLYENMALTNFEVYFVSGVGTHGFVTRDLNKVKFVKFEVSTTM
jgi:hypothetical protein